MNKLTITITPDPRKYAQAWMLSPERLTREMGRAIARLIQEMARGARQAAPKAFSTLTHSISPRQLSPLEGIVAAGVNYARMAEEGTGLWGPYKQPSGKLPPVENLLDWVKVKHLQPDDPAMSQEDLAFVIARSIAARGTPSQPYFAPTVRDYAPRGQSLMLAAIDRTLEAFA